MDRLSNVTPGAKILLGAATAFLVCSLFKWFTLDVGEPVRENMWNGLGILAGLLAIGLVWQAIRSRTLSSRSAAGPALVIAALALLLVISTFILFIDKPSRDVPSMDATASSIDRTFWAWLGLGLALVVAVGAWMNMRATKSAMDRLSKLTNGAKTVLGAATAFLIFSLFNWFTLGLVWTEAGEDMWHGVGILAGLLAVGLVVWQAIRLANIELEIGGGQAIVTGALAVLLVISTFIRVIDKPSGEVPSLHATASVIDRTFWPWLGLGLALVVAVGAWMNMRATGDKFSKLTHGAKVVLGAAIAFLIVSFFNWFDLGPLEDSENMWKGIGFLAGYVVIGLVVLQALPALTRPSSTSSGAQSARSASRREMVTAALAVLLMILTFIRFIDKPGRDLTLSVVDRTFWAWLGLALAFVVAVVAWMNAWPSRPSSQSGP